jgi:hypothetical protein
MRTAKDDPKVVIGFTLVPMDFEAWYQRNYESRLAILDDPCDELRCPKCRGLGSIDCECPECDHCHDRDCPVCGGSGEIDKTDGSVKEYMEMLYEEQKHHDLDVLSQYKAWLEADVKSVDLVILGRDANERS